MKNNDCTICNLKENEDESTLDIIEAWKQLKANDLICGDCMAKVVNAHNVLGIKISKPS